jgi:hypothetical protein
LDRKWTNIIIWPRDRASISVQQLRIHIFSPVLADFAIACGGITFRNGTSGAIGLQGNSIRVYLSSMDTWSEYVVNPLPMRTDNDGLLTGFTSSLAIGMLKALTQQFLCTHETSRDALTFLLK